MDPINIYVAHPQERALRDLISMVQELGHEVVGSASRASEMIDECTRLDHEMIISGVKYDDGNGIEALLTLSRHAPRPAVIVAQNDDLEDVERAMDDHVMAYLVAPVTAEDLRPTILVVKRRFEQFQQLQRENDSLREAMQVRKLVERAKGILMRRLNLDEEHAYLRLQSMATSKRVKMRDVAQLVIGLEG